MYDGYKVLLFYKNFFTKRVDSVKKI